MGVVLEITYRHAKSASTRPYRHVFKPGDELRAMPDGSLVIRNKDGRPLWGDYVVPDNA